MTNSVKFLELCKEFGIEFEFEDVNSNSPYYISSKKVKFWKKSKPDEVECFCFTYNNTFWEGLVDLIIERRYTKNTHSVFVKESDYKGTGND